MLKKIIIVEDDTFLQDFYRLFFKKIGANVLIIEDTDTIIKEIQTGEVDLIIMDINLRNTMLNNQRIDGAKLSRYIKLNFAQFRIPILLITAYSVSSLNESLLDESLADDYLLKPIADLNQLIEKINKLVFDKNER